MNRRRVLICGFVLLMAFGGGRMVGEVSGSGMPNWYITVGAGGGRIKNEGRVSMQFNLGINDRLHSVSLRYLALREFDPFGDGRGTVADEYAVMYAVNSFSRNKRFQFSAAAGLSLSILYIDKNVPVLGLPLEISIFYGTDGSLQLGGCYFGNINSGRIYHGWSLCLRVRSPIKKF